MHRASTVDTAPVEPCRVRDRDREASTRNLLEEAREVGLARVLRALVAVDDVVAEAAEKGNFLFRPSSEWQAKVGEDGADRAADRRWCGQVVREVVEAAKRVGATVVIVVACHLAVGDGQLWRAALRV